MHTADIKKFLTFLNFVVQVLYLTFTKHSDKNT